MKVGGKFYLAEIQRQGRFSYARQINRRAIRVHQEAVRFYGQALFSAQIVHGEERARQAIALAAQRMSDEMRTRLAASYSDLGRSLGREQRGGGGLDLRL